MSVEAAEAFFKRIEGDPELQKRLQEVGANLMALGKQEGFDFSMADVRQMIAARYGVKSIEKTTDQFTIS